jgi:hypothetical protein
MGASRFLNLWGIRFLDIPSGDKAGSVLRTCHEELSYGTC